MPRLALLAACVAAASAASFTATLPPSLSDTTQLNFPILDCIGSSHGSLALRADYREHLARVQRDIGFKHIRGHGLLDDDMSTLLGGHANLFNLFSVLDYYLSVGLRPIMELSFMPEALALDASKTIMHYKGITSTFKDAGAWTAFIIEVLQGLQARYGVDETRAWRYEVRAERAARVLERRPPASSAAPQSFLPRPPNLRPLAVAPPPCRRSTLLR